MLPKWRFSNKDPKHRECGKGLDFKLSHYWDCRLGEIAGVSQLMAPSGEVENPGQVAPTTRSLILVPPTPKEEVFKVFFNLNWWKGYCYHKILLMVPRVGDGDHPFRPPPKFNKCHIILVLNRKYSNQKNVYTCNIKVFIEKICIIVGSHNILVSH